MNVIKNEKIEMLNRFVQNTDVHIFLTGKAGTGKTTFLRNLAVNTYKRMVIVAPTGVAAINAGGVTIHSFFQLPFGPIVPDTGTVSKSLPVTGLNAQKINKTKLKIMRSLDLLVIDEISMVRADLLDAVDAVLRKARRNNKAFGGVQLLMIGDIQQLAPVARPNEWELLQPYYKSVYFFDSHVLQNNPYICIELKHIFRQNDTTFIEILNQVRNNCLDAKNLDILNSRYLPNFNPHDKEGYITLTTHNYQADDINETKLEALQSELLTFEAKIEGVFPENAYPTKEVLELKVGAQVMFVKNDPSAEKQYYNGKIGKIVSYDKREGLMVQCDDALINVTPVQWQNFEYTLNEDTNEIEEKEIGSFTQIPLKTAWAITIHKSQGLTFEKVILNAEMAFAHGQVYVALSRCTSLDGLVLKAKMSRNVLFNDNVINNYVEQIPSLEPDEKQLAREEWKFYHQMIMELFSFNDLELHINRLAKAVRENDNIFGKETVDKITERRQNFRTEIIDVSMRFYRQVDSILAQHNDTDFSFLQERIRKASAYFFEKLNDMENIGNLIHETDNKAVNTLVKEIINIIREILFVKTACLDVAKNGFDVEKYLEVKNKKTVESEGLKSSKLKSKSVDKKDKPLMDRLRWWVERKAEELEVEEFRILPKNVLVDIVKKKPVSVKELKEISKLGATRIKNFGADIINMVLEYQGFKKMEFDDEDSVREMNLSRSESLTLELLDEGRTIDDIAKERGLARSTIESHIYKIVKCGLYDATDFVSKEHYDTIKEYFDETGDTSSSSAREVLGEEYSYFELRLVLDNRNNSNDKIVIK
ncbi:MAG: helix-turn-helix domain-containing protein [Bacteroidales bacterium]|nr:helix-turn-helix domain-containing protein [Bacteroidales bacterium]